MAKSNDGDDDAPQIAAAQRVDMIAGTCGAVPEQTHAAAARLHLQGGRLDKHLLSWAQTGIWVGSPAQRLNLLPCAESVGGATKLPRYVEVATIGWARAIATAVMNIIISLNTATAGLNARARARSRGR